MKKKISGKILVNTIIDIYVCDEDFSTYHYKGWYWIINPVTREWIVNVSDSGYTFFNRDFWKVVSKLYPTKDMTKDIRNWVVYKLGVPFSKHYHPDYIDGDYDWRDEFKGQLIIDVINKGEKIK